MVLLVAAPVAMACQVAAWLGAVWLGFAPIYLPSIEAFAYEPSVCFGECDLLDALYVSGASLTTVGFGDVVATTDALRLALDGGPSELAEVYRALVRFDQQLKRFPILYYYFHNPRPAESTPALVHGCTLICLHLHWGHRLNHQERRSRHEPTVGSARSRQAGLDGRGASATAPPSAG